MKKLFALCAAAVLLFVASAPAQTTDTNTTPPIGGDTLSSWININATNWVVIPYLGYDLKAKQFGAGAAALYMATPNLWAGLRFENFKGQQTTAGVQGQLQVQTKILGLEVTPFLETSIGIGKSALYGSAGPGALINIHTWTFASGKALGIGVVGDYEHYVMGGQNGNKINGGLLVHYSF